MAGGVGEGGGGGGGGEVHPKTLGQSTQGTSPPFLLRQLHMLLQHPTDIIPANN